MNDFGKLLEAQGGVAFLVALCLPVGLLLLAARPAWLDRAAAETDRRRTAAALFGAGIFLLALVAGKVLAGVRPLRWSAGLVLAAVVADFAAGFAATAWSQGRAMLRRDGGASCMTWGWLARAGVFAVPVIGVVLGAYFVALALGAPVVAWLGRPKSTTEPSPGSAPAN